MKSSRRLISAGNSVALKYILSVFVIFSAGFMLLRFPETAGQGISDGIDLCLGTLIPSLYPFMIISSLAINLDSFRFIENFLSKSTEYIFRLPGKTLCVIIMSMIGGFPLGGKMTKELYEKGRITPLQGKRLLLFCVNPGPAFTISSVGFYLLGSKKTGLIIYISLILSSLIICFLTRFISQDDEVEEILKRSEPSSPEFSSSLVSSVSSGSSAMLNVCCWVIAFSCLVRLTDILPLSSDMRMFVCSLLEVTNACSLAAGNLSIPAIAAIIGFGGICTHFQIMNAVKALKLKYKYFITGRIIHCGLSAVICDFFLKISPVSYDVFSLGTLPNERAGTVSVPISIGMLIMCALIMLGDSFRIQIKRKKEKLSLT